jgi:hypothetical protein
MKAAGTVLLLGSFFIAGPAILAQDCEDYFPQKEGTVLEYVNFDKKDKITGSSETSLKEKKEIPGGMSAVFASKFKDDKGEVLYENEVPVECREGVLYFDASKFLDPATLSAYSSMEVAVTGDNLMLPLNAPDGTPLDDGGVTAVVTSEGMKIMTITVDVSNRKVAGREKMETPAGTFECVKFTYDVLSKIGFVKVSASAIEWYNPRYGTVRSEAYDKSGKLTGYTLLQSIKD